MAIAVTCSAAPGTASGRVQGIYTIAMPAGTLRGSLLRVARLTGLQVAFSDPAIGALATPAIHGRMTVEAMLRTLTCDLPVSYRYLGDNTILVSPRPVARPRKPQPRSERTLPAVEGLNIVVTSARREQRIADLPISVTSFTGAMLEARDANSMRDIALLTPGVLLRNTWGASTNLSVRGIYSTSGSATTGVYFDDIPIQTRSLGAGITSTNVYPALLDIERVEVLRGPQGALFGSGSVGGTVRFLAREPNLAASSLRIAGETSIVRNGGTGYELTGALGVPVVADRIGLRLSGLVQHRPGWIDRVDAASGTMVDRDSNSLTTEALRGVVSIKLGEGLEMQPAINWQVTREADSDLAWNTLSDAAHSSFRSGAPVAQPARDSFLLPSLRFKMELPVFTALSTTSYFRRRRHSIVDYTNFMVEMLTRGERYTLDEVPEYRTPVVFDNNQDVLTQEFRLTSTGSARSRWIAGLFLQRARQDAVEVIHEPLLDQALQALAGTDAQHYFGSELLPGGISYIGTDRSIDTQAALFGQLDHAFTPHLTATIGGRIAWTHYKQTNVQNGPQSGGALASRISHGELPLLPRFGLLWQPSLRTLVYITAAKGLRIGGGNANVSPLRCGARLNAYGYSKVPESYSSDRIWSYEIGTKTQALGGRISLEAAAFHFDWSDVQQSVTLRCLFRFTGNSPAARGNGGEFELRLLPTDDLEFNLAGSYTNAKYVKPTYGGVIDETSGERAVLSSAGQRLPAPPLRLTGFARFSIALRERLKAWISANAEYASAYAVGNARGSIGYDPIAYRSPATFQTSLRAGVQREGLEAVLFADNLLDSHDSLQISHTFANSDLVRSVTLRPRTVGIRLTYTMP